MSVLRPTSTYRLDLLGAPRITTGASEIPTSKPIVFVAALYLGMNRGRAVRRTHLGALLWPDADDRVRGERLRWLVVQLKRYGIPLERYESEDAAAAFVRRYVAELRIDRWKPRPELQRILGSTSAARQNTGVCVPGESGLGATTPASLSTV